jgi:hypothetical protein
MQISLLLSVFNPRGRKLLRSGNLPSGSFILRDDFGVAEGYRRIETVQKISPKESFF